VQIGVGLAKRARTVEQISFSILVSEFKPEITHSGGVFYCKVRLHLSGCGG
jgi:hypothetical protein